MKAIVAVCKDWAIGKDGKLLIANKQDMKHFVELTRNTTVIMGRKTLESFPGKKPLKNRRNIVITREANYAPEGCTIVHSVKEALAAIGPDEPAWLIGGDSIYRQMIEYCDECYVTYHNTQVPADTYFPNLDENNDWICVETSEAHKTKDSIEFEYRIYKNLALKS